MKKKSSFSLRVNIWDHYKHLCSKGASRAKGADAQADRTFRLIQKQFAYWFSFSAHGSITTPASYSNAPASRKARREAPQPQQEKKGFDYGKDNSPSEKKTPAAAWGCLSPPGLWGLYGCGTSGNGGDRGVRRRTTRRRRDGRGDASAPAAFGAARMLEFKSLHERWC